MGFGVIGFEGEDGGVTTQSLTGIIAVGEESGEAHPCFDGEGIDFDGAVVAFTGFVEAVEVNEDMTGVEEGVGVIGRQEGGVLEVAQRAPQVAEVGVNSATVDEQGGVVVELRGGAIEVGEGTLGLAKLTQAETSPFVGFGVAGRSLQAVVKKPEGDLVLASDEGEEAMIAKHAAVLAIEGGRHGEVASSVVVLAEHEVTEGELDQQVEAAVSVIKERPEDGLGAFRLVSTQPCVGLSKLFSNRICVHPTP